MLMNCDQFYKIVNVYIKTHFYSELAILMLKWLRYLAQNRLFIIINKQFNLVIRRVTV